MKTNKRFTLNAYVQRIERERHYSALVSFREPGSNVEARDQLERRQAERTTKPLTDSAQSIERRSSEVVRGWRTVEAYGAFLSEYFGLGDWIVTVTIRDRAADLEIDRSGRPRTFPAQKRLRDFATSKHGLAIYKPDPRIESWVPSSKYRAEPGPPVRDAALREIEHWLLGLGWEAAGRTRQEMFSWVADGMNSEQRRKFAKKVSKAARNYLSPHGCLICQLLDNESFNPRFQEVHSVATAAIGWVIAEEFGRLGGRWHIHMLIRGVSQLWRKKWWRRAYVRFGRTRIEPIKGKARAQYES